MYVREYFEEDARQSANDMVKDIRSVFTEIIDELAWMDDETRVRAKEKAASMTTHIAYPDELLDDKKLTDLYENASFISIVVNNYSTNKISCRNISWFSTRLTTCGMLSTWPFLEPITLSRSCANLSIRRTGFPTAGRPLSTPIILPLRTAFVSCGFALESNVTKTFYIFSPHRIPCWHPPGCFLR